jgi:NitT/TauT family transport system permease protein
MNSTRCIEKKSTKNFNGPRRLWEMLKSERLSGILLPTLVFILVIALWEGVILALRIPNYIVPAPHAIVLQIIHSYSEISDALIFTMTEVIVGFVIGSLLGIILAISFFYSSLVERMSMPLISAANSVPKIAFAALAVLWFGTGMSSKIFLAVISSFFPVMVNTLQGLHTCDPMGVYLMRTFGAKEREIFLKYRWPFALHHIFVGLRNASTTTVIVIVISEMMGSAQGVGLIINITQQTADFLLMWAATISISVCGVLFYLLILYIERRIVWWKPGDLS